MELTKTYLDLVKETFALRNYKRMNVACAILSAIVMIPFIFQYVAYMLIYGMFVIAHRLVSTPADYLMSFIRNEGKDVRHAPQTVMYIFGFPLVLIGKALATFIVFIIGILHFLSSVEGYLATLGGITFSPFVLTPVDRTKSEQKPAYRLAPVVLFVVLGLFLLILYTFLRPIAYSIAENLLRFDAWEFNIAGMTLRYNAYELYLRILMAINIMYLSFTVCYVVFAAVYVLAFFRRGGKKCETLPCAPETTEISEATEIPEATEACCVE